MLPFSLGFLAVFLARAPAARDRARDGRRGARVVACFRLWRCAPAARRICGAPRSPARCSAPRRAWFPPSAARGSSARSRRARRSTHAARVARVEGTVEPGGRIDARGASFRLQGGPIVRVAGASRDPAALRDDRGRRASSTRPAASSTAASPEAVTLVRDGPLFSPARLFERLRAGLPRADPGQLPARRRRRVLLPLLIGDGGLPDELREDLARTGTLHVLAVSGTHLSLFLAGLRLFTRKLRILVPVLVVYAGMCAFEPPVLRSLVLAIGFLVRAASRPRAAAGLALPALGRDRARVRSRARSSRRGSSSRSRRSEESSRSAPDRRVARIPSIRRAQRSALEARLRALTPAARAGAGATLATAPAMIWRFNRISPVGIPATLLLSPFIPALLWLGALIVLFPSVPAFPKLATALIDAAPDRRFVAISALPFASVDVPRPHALRARRVLRGRPVDRCLAASTAGRASASRSSRSPSLGVLVADRPAPGLYQLRPAVARRPCSWAARRPSSSTRVPSRRAWPSSS